MYKKDKSLFLVSSVSPFTKNLTISNENHQKLSISSAHKYRFNILNVNNKLETISDLTEVCIETDKEVIVDKDYIIQIKWLIINQIRLLVIALHNGVKIYNSDGTNVLFEKSHSYQSSNPNSYPENSYSSGIASLNSSLICVGANNGAILKFRVNADNDISFDETSTQAKHKRSITDLVSDQKRKLISCDDCGNICVWEYNQTNDDLEERANFEGYNGFSCNCVGIYKNYICAGYGSGHLRVFDITNKSLICEISAHAKCVTAVDIAPETGCVLSTSEDSFVRVWQIKDKNDSIKVCHIFSQNIANHMLFGGVFLNKSGKGFCVAGYDSTELHCFKSD